MIDNKELTNRLTYHAPKEIQLSMYEEIRGEARLFADCILSLTPESREQALAITKLEEAVMWANAAIARRS